MAEEAMQAIIHRALRLNQTTIPCQSHLYLLSKQTNHSITHTHLGDIPLFVAEVQYTGLLSQIAHGAFPLEAEARVRASTGQFDVHG